MDNKLSIKHLDTPEVSKFVSEYNPTDCSVRDSDELSALLVIVLEAYNDIMSQIAAKGRESGYDDLVALADNYKKVIKSISSILGSRADDSNLDDKTFVKVVKDNVVEVVENGETRFETNETSDISMLVSSVSYSILGVEEYNNVTNSNKTEEAYLYDLVNKFIELSLDNCICYSKKYLSDLDASVVASIVESNYSWHTFVGNFTFNKARFNSSIKLYPDKRSELLSLNYIRRDVDIKQKQPSAIQLSVFPEDNEFSEVNVISEGDSDNE